MVEAIHRVQQDNGDVRWQHVLRESNHVADGLVKFGLNLDSHIRVFDFVPSFISSAITANAACTWFPRGF